MIEHQTIDPEKAAREIVLAGSSLPSFVAVDRDCQITDCWRPIALPGEDGFAAGQRLFREAMDFERATGTGLFLVFVLGGMALGPIGPVESGFCTAMAAQAVLGASPAPLAGDMVNPAIRNDPVAYDTFRALESGALSALELARADPRDREVAEYFLTAMLALRDCREMIGGGSLVFAQAALNAMRN